MIALFAAVLSICSWISVPATVPFTMQTFGVFFAVGVLGGKRGTLTVLVYILVGLMGAPVFAGFTGGIGVLFANTGGYIIGFLLSALLMWMTEHLFERKRSVLLLSMIGGLIVCYLFGTLWFMMLYTKNTGSIGLWTALSWCVVPYLVPDAIKIGLAFVLSLRLKRYIK